jgi:chemotaxis protein methyltransferase CheR
MPDQAMSSANTLNRTDPNLGTEFEFTARDFRKIAEIMREESGIVLGENKANLVYSRLAKRLRKLNIDTFREYCDFVVSGEGADERRGMIAAMTTNVTKFFREQHHFDYLRDRVLPQLAKNAKAGDRVRIWSAGCSSGEEPYTIAMTVLGAIPDAASFDFKILATDLDHNMIAHGRAGLYDASATESIPKEYRKFFTDTGSGNEARIQMSDKLRSLIRFNELNLLGNWPMTGGFDVIFCRNVMIYFDDDTQFELCRRYAQLLPIGGTLCIGHSERADTDRLPLDIVGQTTYRKKG